MLLRSILRLKIKKMPIVPNLDGPVSLQGSALADLFKGIFVEPVVEQVIDMPKISLLALAPTRSMPSCDCCKIYRSLVSSSIVG